MKSPYTWTIIVIALLCINSVLLVGLWKEKNQPLPLQGGRVEVKDFLINELSLTPKQVTQFDSLRNIHRATVDSLNDRIHRLRDSLFNNLAKPSPAKTTAAELTRRIGNDLGLIDKATYDHFKDVRELLDARQQKKFDTLIDRVLHMMARQGPPDRPGTGPPPPDKRPEGPPEGPPSPEN